MKKCVYRNFYYVKQSIIDFFKCNKKYLFFSILSIVIGIAFALCVGLNNVGSFTQFNLTDKIIFNFFCNKSWLSLFLKYAFKYFFFATLVSVLSCLNFFYILNYAIFGYLSFTLSLNAIIIASLFNLSGILYVLLCYFPLLLTANFLLIIIFMACKCAINNSCGNNISLIPIKTVVLCYVLILIVLIIFTIISCIFCRFINIIV